VVRRCPDRRIAHRREVITMKLEYRRPELLEYGRIDELTLGSAGPRLDISITLDPLTISVDDAPRTSVTVCSGSTGSADCYKVI
jgi:hypothetical protein